ncbi:hypothetical protein B4U80_13327, partial [Leptotrombidium deliense]
MSYITLVLPSLRCPFETSVNQCEEECEEELKQWWQQLEIAPDDQKVQQLQLIKSVPIASRIIPDATLDDLLLMAKLGSTVKYLKEMFDEKSVNFDKKADRIDTILRG